MGALGAALTGSQILMMHSRPANMIVVKYPSLPRSSDISPTRLDAGTVTFFWGAQGLVVGKIAEVTAPQTSKKLLMRNISAGELGSMTNELESWFRENLTGPAEIVAVGESLRRTKRLSFNDLAELTHEVEKLNHKIFAQPLRPKIVNVEMMNPI
jgi:hypothetical protein